MFQNWAYAINSLIIITNNNAVQGLWFYWNQATHLILYYHCTAKLSSLKKWHEPSYTSKQVWLDYILMGAPCLQTVLWWKGSCAPKLSSWMKYWHERSRKQGLVLQPHVLRQVHHQIKVLHSLTRCSLHKIIYLQSWSRARKDYTSPR